jgi:hypothetical protein
VTVTAEEAPRSGPVPEGDEQAEAGPPADAPTERPTRRWPGRVLFAVCLVAAFALRVALAVPGGGPILTEDALGYMGNARWLAGISEPDFRGAHFYSFGYSLVVAPIYRLGLSASEVVVAVQVLNAAFATAVALPLAALVARVRPTLGPRAKWAGLAASLAPPLLLQPAFLWPETLLPLLFALWALVVWRAVHVPGRGDAVVAAVLAVALLAVHDRTVAVVAATAVYLVGLAVVRRRHRWRVVETLVAVAVLVGGVVAVRALAARMVEVLWRGTDPTNAERAGRMIDRLGPAHWADHLEYGTGQIWYLAASTAGLVVVGAVVAVVGATAVVRRRPVGARRDGLPWLAVVLGTAGVLAAGVVFTRGERVDQLVYGRYNEVWSPVLLALGLAWLVSRTWRVKAAVAAGALPALVGLGWALTALVPVDRLQGNVMRLNILGVLGLELLGRGDAEGGLDRIGVVPVSVLAGVLLAVVALVAVTGARPAAGVLGAAFVALAVHTHVEALAGFRSGTLGHLTVAARAVEGSGVDPGEPIAYDTRTGKQQARKVLQFWVGDDRLVHVPDLDRSLPDLVISRDEGLAGRCYEPIATQAVGGQPDGYQVLWRRVPGCTPDPDAAPGS